jgi:nitrogen regulatory protein P-II 1
MSNEKNLTGIKCDQCRITKQQVGLESVKLLCSMLSQDLIMKKLELIIPDRRLQDVSEILKDANTGGMSYYRIEGRGRIKAEAVAVGRGTMHYKPEFIPRLKVEVVIKDEQVEDLVKAFVNKIGDKIGGKIFVIDVPVAVDLTTKKVGESAI